MPVAADPPVAEHPALKHTPLSRPTGRWAPSWSSSVGGRCPWPTRTAPWPSTGRAGPGRGLRREPPGHRAGRRDPAPSTACSPPSPTISAGSARVGPSTPTSSTRTTARWSTTSSCGGSADETFDVMPNASNTDRVVAAIGGVDTTATRAIIAVQGPTPAPAGHGRPGGGRRARFAVTGSSGRAPPARRPAPATPARTAWSAPSRPRSPLRCGRRSWPPGSSRPASGPGTPSASRPPCPSTATSSAPASPPSRPGWAGWWAGTRTSSAGGPPCWPSVGPAPAAAWSDSPPRAASRPGSTPTWSATAAVGTVTSGNFSPDARPRDRPGLPRAAASRRTPTRSPSSSGARPCRPPWSGHPLRACRPVGRPGLTPPTPTPHRPSTEDQPVGTYIPHTEDEIEQMLGLPGPVHARASCSTPSRRPLRLQRGLELADGAGEPDVLAHLDA